MHCFRYKPVCEVNSTLKRWLTVLSVVLMHLVLELNHWIVVGGRNFKRDHLSDAIYISAIQMGLSAQLRRRQIAPGGSELAAGLEILLRENCSIIVRGPELLPLFSVVRTAFLLHLRPLPLF